MRDFHGLDSHAAVGAFLDETLGQLRRAMRLLAVNEHLLWQLNAVADFTYGWHAVDALTPHMQV